jgi:V/A-type H+-transporting ATPase subunit D
MHLLFLKGREEEARRGLDLLRSKREALVREFFLVMESVVAARGLLGRQAAEARRALATALALEGKASVAAASFAAKRDLPVELRERNVWGVKFPEIAYPAVVRPVEGRGYAPASHSPSVDVAALRYEELLDRILRMLSGETRLKRIGAEIKRTTRRINALNEVRLPQLLRTIRRIQSALEEREREDLFRMKRFKERSARGEEGVRREAIDPLTIDD